MTTTSTRSPLSRIGARRGPSAASAAATSPWYGSLVKRASKGAGGAYGKWGSYRWTNAKNRLPRTDAIQRAAAATVSRPGRSGTTKAARVSAPPRRSS